MSQKSNICIGSAVTLVGACIDVIITYGAIREERLTWDLDLISTNEWLGFGAGALLFLGGAIATMYNCYNACRMFPALKPSEPAGSIDLEAESRAIVSPNGSQRSGSTAPLLFQSPQP